MSYILDAITKAEKQRQQERVPTLASAVSNQHATGKNFITGRVLGMGVIGLSLIAFGWYFKPVSEQVVVDRQLIEPLVATFAQSSPDEHSRAMALQ